MLRFILTIIIYFPYCIYFYFKLKKSLKNKNLTLQQRYDVARKIALTIIKKNRCKVKAFNTKYLDDINGYMLACNHQGRFDGLALISASAKQLSFLVREDRSNISIEKNFLDLIGCKRIILDDPRQSIKMVSELSSEIRNNKNYAVFPEGKHDDNKNTLLYFNSGVFHFALTDKYPIIPVCLYDTYKVYNVNSIRRVECEVHFLKPIFYDEYKNLNKKEIALLVKSRIQEKLDELKENV